MTAPEIPAEIVEAALAALVEPGAELPGPEEGTALNYVRDDLRSALAAAWPAASWLPALLPVPRP